MSLSKQDKADITQLIDNGVRGSMEPFVLELSSLKQIVSGPEDSKEKTGLVSDMVKVKAFQKTVLYIFTILTAIGATITGVLLAIHNGVIKLL